MLMLHDVVASLGEDWMSGYKSECWNCKLGVTCISSRLTRRSWQVLESRLFSDFINLMVEARVLWSKKKFMSRVCVRKCGGPRQTHPWEGFWWVWISCDVFYVLSLCKSCLLLLYRVQQCAVNPEHIYIYSFLVLFCLYYILYCISKWLCCVP